MREGAERRYRQRAACERRTPEHLRDRKDHRDPGRRCPQWRSRDLVRQSTARGRSAHAPGDQMRRMVLKGGDVVRSKESDPPTVNAVTEAAATGSPTDAEANRCGG